MSNFTDFFPAAVGVDLQSSVKTANFTAVANEGYLVNTTSSAITVTLPSSPSLGDEVLIIDYAGTFGTNNVTLTSSDNILGFSDDYAIQSNDVSVILIYTDATKGWKVKTGANEGTSALVNPLINADFLVVAGGGGGGYQYAGGGGAGGMIIGQYTDLAASTNYTVTVGGGGTGGATKPERGANGSNSVFHNSTAIGGGGGGGWDGAISGSSGGSGGGAAMGPTSQTVGSPAGSSTQTSPSSGTGYGNSGGTGYRPSGITYRGGGGGGAGAAGTSAPQDETTTAVNGGIGKISTIISSSNATSASVGEVSGSDVYFAGGGAGGNAQAASASTGGTGGGGSGATNDSGSGSSEYATAGTSNTGGGGGGGIDTRTGGNEIGEAGGSGVVILRYSDAYTVTVGSGITEASGSPFTEGSNKISVFTGGTGNIQFN
jgi:hypothetical protein